MCDVGCEPEGGVAGIQAVSCTLPAPLALKKKRHILSPYTVLTVQRTLCLLWHALQNSPLLSLSHTHTHRHTHTHTHTHTHSECCPTACIRRQCRRLWRFTHTFLKCVCVCVCVCAPWDSTTRVSLTHTG